MNGQTVLPGDRGADRLDDRRQIRAPIPAGQLGRDPESLFPVLFDGEGGDARGANRGMTLLDGPFDVLWIVVSAANDDEVLAASGDEELPVLHEAQITGAQVGSAAGVRQPRSKDLFGLFPAVPISLRDRRTR
ncbi:MAG TPA: hypothetical protein VEO37_07010, partial [Thermoanaerobaculia bacterium]|nr:hypothetical protein [Thermoanaerobaculia bacterium]